MSKAVLLSFMAIVAITNARQLSYSAYSDIKDMVPVENEPKTLLELPFFGFITLKALKVVWFFISTAFTIIGYKLAAIALAAEAVIWIFENKFTLLFGAGLALGVCKLTDLCNWHTKENFLGYNDEVMLYAAKNLDSGTIKYSDKS